MPATPMPMPVPVATPPDPVRADLLRRVRDLVAPGLAVLLDRLHLDASAEDADARRLRRAEADHLELLLDPGTDLATLTARSRELGRVHAMVGLEMDAYAAAAAERQRAVLELVAEHGGHLDGGRAAALVAERFMADLNGALQGYRDVDGAQARVLLHVGRAVAEARTVTDLVRGVLDGLSLLDGMVAVLISRPDETGGFLFEAGAGDGVDELIAWTRQDGSPVVSTAPTTPLGQGPAGQAWRSGDIVVSDAYLTDPATRPWRAWAEHFGWRASAAVPLCDERGAPHALLSLYAAWPGFFAYATRTSMLEQVKIVVERALSALESRPAMSGGVQAYGDRALHLAQLAAGEVEMVYQPLVALPDGALLKLEALARLRDGDRWVSPAEFLPAFGDEELLRLFEIGLDQSLAALSGWERDGLRTGVSVNLPVVSALDRRYLVAVSEALGRHGVDPSRLTLELLESGDILGSLVDRRAALDSFKRLGVRLAQDDLGSGYSSLLRLRHFDFDVVKIDQSLIRGTAVAPRAALQFVQPITDIAHSLGLHVTLEGLETPGLIEAAVQLGVDSGQGYGIARPMRRDAVLDWAQGHRLDLDPLRPSTSLGALAAHVAWEHRVTAVGGSRSARSARSALEAADACALTCFVARSPELTRLHDAVHQAALDGRGPLHRLSWDRLVAALDED